MAGKRIETMELKQLIRLKKDGVSNRQIGVLLRISRNTVNTYCQLLEGLNISLEELLAKDEADLREIFSPESEVSTERYAQLANRFEYLSIELAKPGCTMLALWYEYKEQHPDGYAYTQFTHHYNQWAKKLEPSGKLEHKAGQKIFIDYSGKKLSIVDRNTGLEQPVEVFVAILPCSQYTYVEASENQKRHSLIGSVIRCLEFFGGVPEALVSDGLKSAVTKASRYEPVINKTLKDLGMHYGMALDPARPYSPTDKALVEGAVHLVYQRIFYPLSKMTFFTLSELNKAIAELLTKYNNHLFKHTNYSRREFFLSTEQRFLRALPSTPYQIWEYRRAKVQKMGFIFLSEDKHYYSVPFRYIGKHVEVRYTQDVIEIYYQHQRLCLHKRNRQPGKYSTIADHLSSEHRAFSSWSLEFFEQKASYIGKETADYVRRLILQYSYPEIGYKQAMGIIQLTRQYDKGRIENVCIRAMALPTCSYRTVESMLKRGADQLNLDLPDRPGIPVHENIRGPEYYQ